jgi:hypothetical protein
MILRIHASLRRCILLDMHGGTVDQQYLAVGSKRQQLWPGLGRYPIVHVHGQFWLDELQHSFDLLERIE